MKHGILLDSENEDSRLMLTPTGAVWSVNSSEEAWEFIRKYLDRTLYFGVSVAHL